MKARAKSSFFTYYLVADVWACLWPAWGRQQTNPLAGGDQSFSVLRFFISTQTCKAGLLWWSPLFKGIGWKMPGLMPSSEHMPLQGHLVPLPLPVVRVLGHCTAQTCSVLRAALLPTVNPTGVGPVLCHAARGNWTSWVFPALYWHRLLSEQEHVSGLKLAKIQSLDNWTSICRHTQEHMHRWAEPSAYSRQGWVPVCTC